MKNYVKEGEVLTFTAPYTVATGAGFKVGNLFAVATAAANSGATVEGKLDGVFDFPAPSADVGAIGALVYWDDTAKNVTVTVGTNLLIGKIAETAKSNGQTTVRVRLSGA